MHGGELRYICKWNIRKLLGVYKNLFFANLHWVILVKLFSPKEQFVDEIFPIEKVKDPVPKRFNWALTVYTRVFDQILNIKCVCICAHRIQICIHNNTHKFVHNKDVWNTFIFQIKKQLYVMFCPFDPWYINIWCYGCICENILIYI